MNVSKARSTLVLIWSAPARWRKDEGHTVRQHHLDALAAAQGQAQAQQRSDGIAVGADMGGNQNTLR